MSQPTDPRHIKRAQRVLLMVHELHKQGYQRLRIAPGYADPGGWQCAFTPVSNVQIAHGALLVNPDEAAHYVTGQANYYFDWRDSDQNSARHLAIKFTQRFPKIAKASLGRDWSYAGWYVEMLGFAEQDVFPMAYGGEEGCLARIETRELPYPPPGEAH
ncbi:MAG: hypothetical protein K8R88_01740 [Armatimonadetes bacterium]|nr:hypothetical protein [Armatimonadota bacterium]